MLAGYIIRRKVDETPAFEEEAEHGEVPQAPIVMAFKENGATWSRVVCMALMNAIPTAVTVFGPTFATNAALRRRPDRHELPVDLGVRQHRRRHR